MVRARNPLRNWFAQNSNVLFPLLAFLVPVLVRAIPELLMGQFLVGFDSIGYYVPNTLVWLKQGVALSAFLSEAPLIYVILTSIASTGASIVISLKVLSPLLLGFLGLALYGYALKALSWSRKKSLFVVLFGTLFFVALRVSWDMLRSELGLIFLFLALILLQKKKLSTKDGVLLSMIMVLIVFTHQLVTVILFAIVIATLLQIAFQKRKTDLLKLIGYSVPAAFLFSTVLYILYFGHSIPFLGFSDNFSVGFQALFGGSYSSLIVNTLGFLAFCYLPLLPLLVFSVRRFKGNIQLKAWIIWTFIAILSVFVPGGFALGGVLPYRWILLLIYPLAFYAAEGFSAVKWRWYKIGVVFLLAILSLSFLALPNSGALGYFDIYPSYVPKSMLQNTVQLSDCQDTANALLWARNNMPNDASLLTHAAFYGWAVLTIKSDRLIFYGFKNPVQVAQQQSNSSILYLIWWVNGSGWYGQPNLPQSFVECYNSGNIAIYRYAESSS